MYLPEHKFHLDLWEVFVESLQAELVLVLQGLVELMVPVHPPAQHVGGVVSLKVRDTQKCWYSPTGLVSILKGTQNLYFLSEVLTISTG